MKGVECKAVFLFIGDDYYKNLSDFLGEPGNM